jgi:hypothetical protein
MRTPFLCPKGDLLIQVWLYMYSGTCLIRITMGPGKCVWLYRKSEYSDFILVNRNILDHKFLSHISECRKLGCRIELVPLYWFNKRILFSLFTYHFIVLGRWKNMSLYSNTWLGGNHSLPLHLKLCS